jgi:hypothetical protein
MGHHFTCPFSDDTTYTLSGEVWHDKNADGAKDARERPRAGFGIKLGCENACHLLYVPFRSGNTDQHGYFQWTGLAKLGFGSAPWMLCIDEREARKWSIVSVNGAAVAPTDCIDTPVSVPGNQDFSLGVARDES